MERLVERDMELARLVGFYTAASCGVGAVVLVSGAAGTGKTALLHALSERVTEAGGLVMAAAGVRAESSLPLGLITELFAGHTVPLPVAERLTGLIEERFVSGAGTTGATEQLSSRTLRRLWEALRELAMDTPVLLAVDDIQHADEATLQLLLYIVRRVRTAPILLVLAEPEHSHRANPLFRAELLREPTCGRIHVGRLSTAGVSSLVADRLSPADAAQLDELSGGNPLLVHALLVDQAARVHQQSDHGAAGLVVGDAFSQAVRSCVHRFEPTMLTVVCGLAVLGTPATPGTLARVLDIDAADAAWSLRGLEDIGLLDAGRFRHPAIAAAVVESMPGEERDRWHRRIAAVLHDDGEPAIVVARHLIAAVHTDEPWALSVLQEAAEQGDLGDDVDFAVQCLELAMAATETEQQRATVSMRLLTVQWRVNPATAVRHLNPLTESLLAGHLAPKDASAIVRALLWHGNLSDVSRVLEAATGAMRCADPEVVARLRIAQEWLRGFCPALLSDGPADIAALGVSPVFSQSLQAATALTNGLIHEPDAETVAVAEQVLQGGRLDDDGFDWIESALLTLVYADRPERAALWCGPLFEQAAARGAATWQARLAAVQGEIALHQGDLASAERWAHAALTLIPARGWGVAIGGPVATLILAATEAGRFEQAARQLRRACPPAMHHTRYGLLHQHARAQYHLATGRLHDALVDFLNCGEQMEQWGLESPGIVPWRVGAATVYLRMGEEDLAWQLVEEQLRQSGGVGTRSTGISRRLLEAAGDLPHGPGTIWESSRVLSAFGGRHELARSLAERGRPEPARPGVGGRAALPHSEQRHVNAVYRTVLEQPGAPDRDSRVITQPALDDATRDGPAVLSDAERRVAELVAVGHTNREVAQALFITVSTVEQHLTRVYRKLNLSGRSDLSTHFNPGAPDPP